MEVPHSYLGDQVETKCRRSVDQVYFLSISTFLSNKPKTEKCTISKICAHLKTEFTLKQNISKTMRKFISLLFLPLLSVANAQTPQPEGTENPELKWFQSAEFTITIPNQKNAMYSYWKPVAPYSQQLTYVSRSPVIGEVGILSLDYSINYQLLKHLSVGAVGGITKYGDPKTYMLKTGSVIRFYPRKASIGNAFVQLAAALPFAPKYDYNASFGEAKMGISLPLGERNGYGVLFSLFLSYNSLEPQIPLLKEDDTPEMVEYRGAGFSLAIKF
jgi:hypothetical protein